MSSYIFSVEPIEVGKVETRNRTIQTPIPCPGTKEILQKLSKYESEPKTFQCMTHLEIGG